MGLASAVVAMTLAVEPFSVAVGRLVLEGYFEVGEARLAEEAIQGFAGDGMAAVSPGQARVRLGAVTAEANRLLPWIVGAYLTSAVAFTAFWVLRWLGTRTTEVEPVLVLVPGGAVLGLAAGL